MISNVRINIHPSFDVLAATNAARLITKLLDVQNERGEATVVLTGGTVGIATLKAVVESPACAAVDWAKVNFWWGDERFVGSDDEDRNAVQASAALIAQIQVDPARVHRMGSADDFADVDAAAADYVRELGADAVREHNLSDDSDGSPAPALPRFDVLLLGIGPDAHIASLFPEMAGVRATDGYVVGVVNSPKPPPLRTSLTLPAINSAQEIWLVAAGSDKAGAVGLALAGANPVQVPAAGPHGRSKTLWLIDQDAAAEIPQQLIFRQDR
ncbi:6-phosphogluconolactonase [Paenarthrobacter sp. Z7-10]|uniref:6-phosphogluconolactonase n=1 Tax=Paenarthrobacter sp. Z7-10 TaxID=2787635 RepID=UPI0022A91735|nr:6-phosphogluconolactonase [Paenarthrobacter sp. Z7-10]MCZ2402669.1 6-phosphogluconolactonase [Paenarthrobacter sp. Z7-10]